MSHREKILSLIGIMLQFLEVSVYIPTADRQPLLEIKKRDRKCTQAAYRTVEGCSENYIDTDD